LATPVDLLVDDVLLAANRADLLGDSTGSEDGLYVRRAGRRWQIGARGHGATFELTFANGQFIEWFNTASDPHHLHNLLGGMPLGPRPVVVRALGTNVVEAAAPEPAVVVRSKMVEMNSVRVVISSEWRFVYDAALAQESWDEQPFQRWTYTIYPTGQLYVGVEATAATDTWRPRRLGLAVSLVTEPGDAVTLQSETASTEMPDSTPAYGVIRRGGADAQLLYALAPQAGRPVRLIRVDQPGRDTDGRTSDTSLIAVTDQDRPVEHSVALWASHLLLAGAGDVRDDELRARAVDYADPVAPRVEVGSLVPTAGADGAAEGFDPVQGLYTVGPDADLVRFVIDGQRQPRFAPAFRIADTAERDAWVYLDHLVADCVARDRQGDLIFQVPGSIRAPVTVEVHLRPRAPGG
jgi:hypothetical protein